MQKALTLLALIGSLWACGGAEAPPLDVHSEELPSPAGEDSGEPFLSSDGDGVYLSWLESAGEGEHELRFATWVGGAWSEPSTIARSERFFVNWADFPSVTAGPDGTLWAHWLERGAAGGYDYGVRVVRSGDGGKHWSAPWTPHEDASPTEHGFVATLPLRDGMGFVWLDGRKYAPGADGSEPTSEMTLRYRFVASDGTPGPESLVDGRVCDCCQTDAAVAASGPVVVYRDRSDGEIRDIYVARLVGSAWTEGHPVHRDGWRIEGCPVNGPAVAARDDDVAVAGFTAAGDIPRVRVAFSSDGGRSFGPPVEVDGGSPAGRVDVLMSADGSALVSWLERTGGEQAEVRVRRVTSAGGVSGSATLTSSSAARASGFPRLARAADGAVLVAWTDVAGERPRVRVQRLTLEDE